MSESSRAPLRVVSGGTAAATWRRFVRERRAGTTKVRALWLELLGHWRAKGQEVDTYESAGRLHLLPAFGELGIDELAERPEWVLAWMDAQTAAGSAPKTARKHLSALSSLFEFGISVGACRINPTRLLPRSELPPQQPRDPGRAAAEVLSIEELTRLLFEPRIAIWRRALYGACDLAGLRIAEAGGADRRHRSPRRPLPELLIQQQWCSKTRKLLPLPKNRQIRRAPVHPALTELLEELHLWALDYWGRPLREDEPLLPYPLGGRDIERPRRRHRPIGPERGEPLRWQEKQALRYFHGDLELLGIASPAAGPRRIHGLRHTFVSQLARAEAPIRTVRTITHVPDDRDAFDGYVHLNFEAQCRAVLRLELDESIRKECWRRALSIKSGVIVTGA